MTLISFRDVFFVWFWSLPGFLNSEGFFFAVCGKTVISPQAQGQGPRDRTKNNAIGVALAGSKGRDRKVFRVAMALSDVVAKKLRSPQMQMASQAI